MRLERAANARPDGCRSQVTQPWEESPFLSNFDFASRVTHKQPPHALRSKVGNLIKRLNNHETLECSVRGSTRLRGTAPTTAVILLCVQTKAEDRYTCSSQKNKPKSSLCYYQRAHEIECQICTQITPPHLSKSSHLRLVPMADDLQPYLVQPQQP